MTAPTRFSASAPLKSLGLRPGDTLVVSQADDDVVTVAFNRPTAHRGAADLAREFAQRWTGQFPVPVSMGDARFEHVIAKHVRASADGGLPAMITKKVVADKIAAWLRHEITQEQLVTWAEEAIHEGEFPDAEAPELAQVVGRLGLADAKEFGLVWEDCRALLQSLGFTAKVEITAA